MNKIWWLLLVIMLGLGLITAWMTPPVDSDFGDYRQAQQAMQQILASDDWEVRQRMIKQLAYQVGPEMAIQVMNESSLPRAGKAHLMAHRIGEAAYDLYGIKALPVCYQDAFSGCSHGLMTVAIADVGFEGVKQMIDHCRTKSQFRYHMCLHAAGHSFLALEEYQVRPALEYCDQLVPAREENAVFHCYNGLFMENVHGNHDNNIPQSHPDLRFDDLQYPCNAIDQKYQRACYLNQAGWWAAAYAYNLERTTTECLQVPEQYQAECADNVGRIIATVVNNQPDDIWEACQHLPDDLAHECFTAVARSVASQGEVEQGMALCSMLPAAEQDRCYMFIVAGLQEKYAADDPQYIEYCQQLPTASQGWCQQDFWGGS